MSDLAKRNHRVYGNLWAWAPLAAPAEICGTMLSSLILERSDRSPPTLADLGCGPGRHSLCAADLGFVVTAVDRDDRVVKRLGAARGDRPVTVIRDDFVHWIHLAAPCSLDAIICYDALHQAAGRTSAIIEVLSTFESRLKAGGDLVVTLMCEIEDTGGNTSAERFRISAHEALPILDRALRGCDRIRSKQRRGTMPYSSVRVAAHYRKRKR